MATPPKKSQDRSKQAIEELIRGEEGLDVDALARLADAMAGERATELLQQRAPDAVEELKRLCGAYHEPAHEFKEGDIVRWKKGLKNKRRPDYDLPVVVWEVLDTPRVNSSDSSGSQYFNEKLDLLIAYFLDDGDIGVYHVDKHRFEPHPDFQG